MAAITLGLTNFGCQAYYSFRGLFLWLTPWSYASNMFIAPFVNVCLFALVTRHTTGIEPGRDLLVGLSLLGMASMINGGVLQSFTYERDFGTLAVIFASRANRIGVYWSRGLLHLGNGLVAATVALVASAAVFGFATGDLRVPLLVLAMVASGWSCVAFALFVGNFTLVFRNWLILYGASQSAMLALTGAVIPRSELPALVRAIGEVLPLTHGMSAARQAFAGAQLGDIRGDLVSELGVAVLWAAIGTAIYRWIEYRARKGGEFHE